MFEIKTCPTCSCRYRLLHDPELCAQKEAEKEAEIVRLTEQKRREKKCVENGGHRWSADLFERRIHPQFGSGLPLTHEQWRECDNCGAIRMIYYGRSH